MRLRILELPMQVDRDGRTHTPFVYVVDKVDDAVTRDTAWQIQQHLGTVGDPTGVLVFNGSIDLE